MNDESQRTQPPTVGTVFVSPRGRRYRVIGSGDRPSNVKVVDIATGNETQATWCLMVPWNGWHRVEVGDA